MELSLPKNTFFRRHFILAATLSLLLVVAVATGITMTVLYNAVFVVSKESKLDRVSEGIVPTDKDLESSPHYSHIMIFGVDGAGGNFDKIDTPNFDRIFSKGSINLNGVSEYPTISAENWGSMFMGVTPQKHQITNEKASNSTEALLNHRITCSRCSWFLPIHCPRWFSPKWSGRVR